MHSFLPMPAVYCRNLFTLLSLVVLFLAVPPAQAQQYSFISELGPKLKQQITDHLCACLGELEPAAYANRDKAVVALGLCMIQSLQKESSKVEKALGKPVSSLSQAEWRQMGEGFGVLLASECPDLLLLVSGEVVEEMAAKELEKELDPESQKEITGQVLKVGGQELAYLWVDTGEEVLKLLWLGHFVGAERLAPNPDALLKKQVRVEYRYRDYYTLEDMAYATYREIIALQVLE